LIPTATTSTRGGQGALAAAPVDNLKLTASLLYQNVYNHDRDQYWASLTGPGGDEFRQASRVRQPSKDEFYLPALKVQYDLEKVSFVSNTSYFYHRDWASLDYTNYFAASSTAIPRSTCLGCTVTGVHHEPAECLHRRGAAAVHRPGRSDQLDGRAVLFRCYSE